MKKLTNIYLYCLLVPILMTLMFVYFLYGNRTINDKQFQFISLSTDNFEMLPIQNIKVKDTVFVMGNHYVEISLNEQICRLYSRTQNYIEYKISSGNPFISKGMETTTGLFSVQTKNPLGKSKQFNNAELHNWIGFNVNIGFHGLAGNSYYSLLGVKPSSHGCVRISREDGKALYSKVQIGTPVLVYKEEPAVALAFLDTNINHSNSKYYSKYILLPSDSRTFKKEMIRRQQNLYDSVGFVKNTKKLLMDGTTIIRWGGYGIGNADSIPYFQYVKNPITERIIECDVLSVFCPFLQSRKDAFITENYNKQEEKNYER